MKRISKYFNLNRNKVVPLEQSRIDTPRPDLFDRDFQARIYEKNINRRRLRMYNELEENREINKQMKKEEPEPVKKIKIKRPSIEEAKQYEKQIQKIIKKELVSDEEKLKQIEKEIERLGGRKTRYYDKTYDKYLIQLLNKSKSLRNSITQKRSSLELERYNQVGDIQDIQDLQPALPSLE